MPRLRSQAADARLKADGIATKIRASKYKSSDRNWLSYLLANLSTSYSLIPGGPFDTCSSGCSVSTIVDANVKTLFLPFGLSFLDRLLQSATVYSMGPLRH
jgi:hypothetical protein